MTKGKKHYSGKELILRRQIQRQQEEKTANPGNSMTKTLRRANSARRAIEKAREKMRGGTANGTAD